MLAKFEMPSLLTGVEAAEERIYLTNARMDDHQYASDASTQADYQKYHVFNPANPLKVSDRYTYDPATYDAATTETCDSMGSQCEDYRG